MTNRKSELYNYIKTYENYDSDYWTLGNGNNEILFILKKYTQNSWQNLKEEIDSWNTNEIEILAGALSDENSWIYTESISHILVERSSLFAYIFVKIDTMYAIDLLDRFEFIFKGNQKSVTELLEIKNQFEKIINSAGIEMFNSKERINFLKNILEEQINAHR